MEEIVSNSVSTNNNLFRFENLAKRLLKLNQQTIDENSSNTGISVIALINFLRFLSISSINEMPSISLTDDNNIYAVWTKDRGDILSVHFLSSGDVNYVVAVHDDRGGNLYKKTGMTTIDKLMILMEPDIEDWLEL